MASYNSYAQMTPQMKERMVDGEDFQEQITKYNLRSRYNQTNRTPKRHHSGEQGTNYTEEQVTLQDDGQDNFQIVHKHRKKKLCRTDIEDNVDQNDVIQLDNNANSQHRTQEQQRVRNVKNGKITNTSRTFINGNFTSMIHQLKNTKIQKNNNDQLTSSTNSMQNDDNIQQHNNHMLLQQQHNDSAHQRVRISEHTLQYAIEQHLPPIKINCEPKINDNKIATCLIKELFSLIEQNFRKINPKYCKPMGFDYWFIDRDGNLSCFTRGIELFVFLCDKTNYPNQILNTTITPSPLKRLPPQCSVIFKFVSNDITVEELKAELMEKYHSVFAIEEMRGTHGGKNRHIRLDLTDQNEYTRLLNGGVLAVAGQLIEVSEFLAPPRLLICSRCNTPGHIKKHCKEDFDKCRRCGTDKAHGEHLTCDLQCHHCKGAHESTSFKCPIINEFRHELIQRLKERPDLLPYNVQIFIPKEFRNQKDMNNRMLINNTTDARTQRQQQLQQQQAFSYQVNDWPKISGKEKITTSSSASWIPLPTDSNTVWNEMVKTQSEFDLLKRKFDQQEQALLTKYNNYKLNLGSILSLISVQVQQQHESLNAVFSIIKEVIPVIASSLIVCEKVSVNAAAASVDQIEKTNFEILTQQIHTSIDYLNDQNNLISNKQSELLKYSDKNTQMMKRGVELFLSSNE